MEKKRVKTCLYILETEYSAMINKHYAQHKKMNANIIAHFVIVWHTDEKPTSDHTKHQIQFSVQKDEDRDRNMKTEREIRRQREKYEDGERNTKTGRKIQIQRKKI